RRGPCLHRARQGRRERGGHRAGIQRAQHLTRGFGKGSREGGPSHPRGVSPLRTLNHYSFLIVVAAVFVPTVIGVAITLAPVGAAALPAVLVTFALDLAVLGGVWLALRSGRSDIRSQEELDRALRGGRPVVVELYSNFCFLCMSNRQAIKLATTILGVAAGLLR